MKSSSYEKYFKWGLDAVVSAAGLVILSPLLLMTALLVKTNMGSPVIFRQKRPGLNGRIFTLYKFRTMTNKKGEDGKLLPDRQRLASFGRFLRSSSIDELPELYNVLRGDMSLVGPRPLLVEYLPLYNEEQSKRHDVRPGLTGLSQVSGRNALSWGEKFALDVYYAENMSFPLDCGIIMRTPGRLFRREGINQKNRVSMGKFWGNLEK